MCYNKVVTPPKKSAIINTGGKSNGKLRRRIQEKDSAEAHGRKADDKKPFGEVPRFRERNRALAEKIPRRMLKRSCCKGRIRPHEGKDNRIVTKCVYSVLGINMEGQKEILGTWISEN